MAAIADRAADLAGPFAIPVGLAVAGLTILAFMMRGPGRLQKLDQGGQPDGPASYRL